MNAKNEIITRRGRDALASLRQQDVRLHGFLLTSDGETAIEEYFAPGDAYTPHRMYSVSKSFTSIAVGVLAGRGEIDIERKAIDYLPDLAGEDAQPESRVVTLKNLLTMTSGHTHRAHKPETDFRWAKAFFREPFPNRPGTVFGYDSTGTQLLAEICRRVSGETLIDFMRREFFDKIDATDEKGWLTDGAGVEQAGSGLFLTLRDLSKSAVCLLNGGMGVIDQAYLRNATAEQVPVYGRGGQLGYGYQFWVRKTDFSMRGMDGQLAICAPSYGVTLCVTGDTHDQPHAHDQIISAFDSILRGYDLEMGAPPTPAIYQ